MIEKFLQRFVFVTDSSSRDVIDLKLTLKSLPYMVDAHNVYRLGMLNFALVQKSLIAFLNDD